MSAEALLHEATKAGWKVWLDGETLKCRMPKNGPSDLLQRLREHKPEIRQLLAANDDGIGGHRLTDREAWATITDMADRHGINAQTLADSCCKFPEGLVLWDMSPTRQTDGVSTGEIKLYPDVEALECCALLLARDAKLDTAGDPLTDFPVLVKCCDCRHWRPLEHHPDMGGCAAGCKPTGLYFWGATERRCGSFRVKA